MQAEAPLTEIDQLALLEERVLKAITAMRELRSENAALREELDALKLQLSAAGKNESDMRLEAQEARAEAARLQEELDSLKSKRKQVVTRIEKLLEQMDLPIQE